MAASWQLPWQKNKEMKERMTKPNMRVHLNIPVARKNPVLTWDNDVIAELVKAAIKLTVSVGLRLDDDEGAYLSEAKSKGAAVDSERHAVKFTESQVEETIRVMRAASPVADPLRPPSRAKLGRDQKFCVGNGANMVFDWDAWTVKAPGAHDLAELCHWAQGCEDVESLFPPVIIKDIDQRLSAIYSYALICKHCRKRVYHEQATEPIHVRYLEKMARIVEKHRGFFQPMQEWEFVNPPFRIGRRSIATMLARVDSGACRVMGIGSMAVAGMSAPVTVAGLAVTALAEMLAALTFFRILRPGYGLKAVVCTGALDLRTARVSYFGMHTHLGNIATWELVTRGLGIDSSCLTWYRDANEPGMQALYEFGMAQAFFSSVLTRCSPEIGGLACGNIFSPHQAVLDMEVFKEFNELLYGFEASEEALGMEDIVNAGFEQGVHMSTEHTLSHMKDGIPFSDFLYHGMSAGAQHDARHTQTDQLLKKAAESVEAAKVKGKKSDPDLELSGELYELVKEAAAELDLEAPPLP